MRTELTETTFAQIKPTKINLSLIGRFKTMPVYGAEPVPLEHARNGKAKPQVGGLSVYGKTGYGQHSPFQPRNPAWF